MRRILGIVLAGFTFAAVAPAAASAEAAHTPVVFVHGYIGSTPNWDTAMTVFQDAGYSSDELYSYEYDYNQSNETSAAGLGDFVNDVRSQTGSDKVNIVNHSMGGLVSRWYVKELDGQQYVENWASLAGANHGTDFANTCSAFASCQEMVPGSDFETQLNSGDETPGDTGYATWYSPCDGVIIPFESTAVEGAQNTEVTCENHLGFLSNEGVLQEVVDFFG